MPVVSALEPLFYPTSIAIIGASNEERSVGKILVDNILSADFGGDIYPVNPHEKSIGGKQVYADIASIGKPVDLSIIAVPAAIVPQVTAQAIAAKTKSILVISSGFSEMGMEGKKRQDELVALARSASIPLVGPNSLGLINPHANLNASFAQRNAMEGGIALVSQSGAICTALLDYAAGRHIGFSKFISVGNKAAVGELELLAYLKDDPQTRVIILYVEALADAAKFIEVCHSIVHGPNAKPIIIMKAGTSEQGTKASMSHTGALAGSFTSYQALFAQSGILSVSSLSEVFDIAIGFVNNPPSQGKNTVIVSDAGGPAILATDEGDARGVTFTPLSDETTEKLSAVLPPNAALHNPVDLLGDAPASRYRDALSILKHDESIDNAIVLLSPQATTEVNLTAQAIVDEWKGVLKPLVVTFMGEPSVDSGIEILEQNNIATTLYPEAATRVIGALSNFYLHARAITEPPFKKFDSIDTSAPYTTVFDLLRLYSIPMLKSCIVHSPDEAVHVAGTIGTNLAMKIESKDISHKTDVGGVLLNIGLGQVETSYAKLIQNATLHAPKAKVDGILIMEMAPAGGTECIVGIKKEDPLGTMIMFGLGGVYVELLQDVAFRFVPLRLTDAQQLIGSTKAGKLFEGFRGQPPLDLTATLDVILRLSQLAADHPEIEELDINPLWVMPGGQGVVGVDARVRISPT